MTIKLLDGVSLHNGDKVQHFTYSPQTPDVTESTLRERGEKIGATSDDEWDIEVFSFKDDFYTVTTFNPPGTVSKLVLIGT